MASQPGAACVRTQALCLRRCLGGGGGGWWWNVVDSLREFTGFRGVEVLRWRALRHSSLNLGPELPPFNPLEHEFEL